MNDESSLRALRLKAAELERELEKTMHLIREAEVDRPLEQIKAVSNRYTGRKPKLALMMYLADKGEFTEEYEVLRDLIVGGLGADKPKKSPVSNIRRSLTRLLDDGQVVKRGTKLGLPEWPLPAGGE